uniref:ATP-dependent zinc metalloprotease FTSH 4-like n=1 Tax=Rhizophora mucronata TaxID=61149 RepID=A0A2P2LWM9_RHIMU
MNLKGINSKLSGNIIFPHKAFCNLPKPVFCFLLSSLFTGRSHGNHIYSQRHQAQIDISVIPVQSNADNGLM